MDIDALGTLAAIAFLNDQRPELIRKARQSGATWGQIAEALGLSEMSARRMSLK